ncbi:glycosyltransferase [Synechococcus sp. CS-1328]|uniref:glycosyltransferase n=1 Tax=Synechococcus sp. CS-1328 TaxID=2847976 RepID=UPI00223AC733|nr:glycosyltransferase [Synechococcus sp. CS-1328]MCT0225915.1 glycosyltransferase [Synechococcus sp. CS-1328]
MVLSVAIPSYGRERVLLDTLTALLALDPSPGELLLIDQTPQHEAATTARLRQWQEQGVLRWLRQEAPSITAAMNLALLEARGERILFLDDDLIPDPGLLQAHHRAAEAWPGALIAGRALQPWLRGRADPEELEPFGFNTLLPRVCEHFIGCNVSMPRRQAVAIGGFDENFVRVAYRFEDEFSHRWLRAGHRIRYEPAALVHHLHAARGGTRSYGDHLRTSRPDHAVGRYYHLLRTEPPAVALVHACGELGRSVRTRHHLSHPWWIPLTLLAELRGLAWALRLQMRGPRLLRSGPRRLLIVTTHPIQYQAPLFRRLAATAGLEVEVLFLCLPDAQQQGVGFGRAFQWDVPLLDGYRWRVARGVRGSGDLSAYLGLWLLNPLAELVCTPDGVPPDAVLITGWQCLGMLQLLVAASLRRLPILLRTEANDLRRRAWPVRQLHRVLVQRAQALLAIGKANARFYRAHGAAENRIWPSPYFVDNAFFAGHVEQLRPHREAQRQVWGIPEGAFCFLFVGKLQAKKRPMDLLQALQSLMGNGLPTAVHALIVGSGELEPMCRSLASQHRLPVSFAGFLNQGELPRAYGAADALVLPSDSGETWGLVVNEAMACGLPAIVSDHVGCGEDLVLSGRTGLVYPCGDVEALAEAMRTLSTSPVRASGMGAEARRQVMEHYGVDQSAEGAATAVNGMLGSVA